MREFSRLPQMESLLARGVLKTRGRGRGRGGGGAMGPGPGGRGVGGPGSGGRKPGAGSIFFLGLGLVSTLTLTLKQRSLKRRDLDSGPDTFRSHLEVYYWVVRKGQTQDELRL